MELKEVFAWTVGMQGTILRIQQTNDKYSFMGCVLKELVDEIEKKHLKAAS